MPVQSRVSSIWVKTASDYQTLLLVTSAAMFLVMGVLLGPMYASLPEETRVAFHDFPEELLALFGGGELGTPEGWYTLETFGLMAPPVGNPRHSRHGRRSPRR